MTAQLSPDGIVSKDLGKVCYWSLVGFDPSISRTFNRPRMVDLTNNSRN